MPIRKIERYKGGPRADVTRIASLGKELTLRNGAMAADPKWQEELAELAKTTTLQDRVLVVELDL